MAINFEQLLRLTADYHNFCNDGFAEDKSAFDETELTVEELEFVAAAAQVPTTSGKGNKE